MNRAYIIEGEPDLASIFKTHRSADPMGDVERFIQRFVVLAPSTYLAVSAWITATYFCDCFDCFPYVALISPAKRCGKTRLLEILELVSHDAWRGTTPSPAALYRMMQRVPTLLLDEVEALNQRSSSDIQQAILSILTQDIGVVPRFCDVTDQLMNFDASQFMGPKLSRRLAVYRIRYWTGQ